MPTTATSEAPAHDPGADGLPWYQRAVRQGVGFSAPSALFVLLPLIFAWGSPLPVLLLVIGAAALVLFFFLGSSVVLHWSESGRWLWLLGLIGSLALLGLAPVDTRPWYFIPYVTTTAATMFAGLAARTVIVGGSVMTGTFSLLTGDLLGVVMAALALSLGLSVSLGMEADRAREALRRSEERTAVLAVAAERERIGRDLHDILGHSLTSVAIKADLATRLIGRDDDAARRETEELAQIARQALADVRATAAGMREVRLAGELAAARSVLAAAGVEPDVPSALPVIDERASEVLGYVVREGVTNVVRHAGATRCTIAVEGQTLRVSDDGRGVGERRGEGLRGLQRRVAEAGGRLEISSSPSGTVLAATMPQDAFGQEVPA